MQMQKMMIMVRQTFMYASQNGHFEIVKFLIENGADPNAKYKYYCKYGSYVCFSMWTF